MLGSQQVSIIIPCYNAEPWLVECLESVIAQTYRPLEIIIIDDGSTDGSLSIIREYAQRYPDLIQYQTGPNRGGCTARNRGFALSQGEYVQFMDADDVLIPETIEGMVSALGGRNDAIAVCPWWNLERTGEGWREVHPVKPSTLDPLLAELKDQWFVPNPALLWPRGILTALGGWDETLLAAQDTDLRWRAILAGYDFVNSNRGGFAWRRYSGNTVSMRKSDKNFESRIRVVEKLEKKLQELNQFEKYRIHIARFYHSLASSIMPHNEQLAVRALQHGYRLAGRKSVHGTLFHQVLCHTVGLRNKERLAQFIQRSPLKLAMGRNRKFRSVFYKS